MQLIAVTNASAITAIPKSLDSPLDHFIAGQLTERTRRAYFADLCQFFGASDIPFEHIRRVTFQDIIAYRNNLSEKGYKRTTINRKLSSLKAFFRMLVASGRIEFNPADSTLVRGFRQDESLAGKAISSKYIKRILTAISEVDDELIRARDVALVHLLIYGGLRRSEAASFAWNDLRQEGAFFILYLPQTKSGVPQDLKLQPVAVHHLEIYRQVLLDNGYPVNPEGKVFLSCSPNSRGKPLTDHAINRIVKRHAQRAGISQNITAHMFRHTCCTLAIEGGAKPQQVQAHLRHKDLKTTMRYYENREKLVDNASDYISV